MTDETLRGRDVAVRLDRPATDNFPAAFADSLPNLGEEGGISSLDPPIVSRRRVGVAEAGRLIHAVEGAAEGGENRVLSVAPRPKPRGVDVRVADDMQDLALLIVRSRS